MTSKYMRLLQEVYNDMTTKNPENQYQDLESDEGNVENKLNIEEIIYGLGRGWNPEIKQIDILQKLTESDVDKLITTLNELGDADDKNWVLKDNLIRQFFAMAKNPNV